MIKFMILIFIWMAYHLYTFIAVEKCYKRIEGLSLISKVCMFLSFYINITMMVVVILAGLNTFVFHTNEIRKVQVPNSRKYQDGNNGFHVPTDRGVICTLGQDYNGR